MSSKANIATDILTHQHFLAIEWKQILQHWDGDCQDSSRGVAFILGGPYLLHSDDTHLRLFRCVLLGRLLPMFFTFLHRTLYRLQEGLSNASISKDRNLAFAAGGAQGSLVWPTETNSGASAIYGSAWIHRSFLLFFRCRLSFWIFSENLTIKVHVLFSLNAGVQASEQSTIAPGLYTSWANRQATFYGNHDFKH